MSSKLANGATAACALTLASMAGASAHVTLETPEAKVGAGYRAVFKLPHGCEGSATTQVRIDIPEGVIAVKPMPKPGWTIELVRKPYAQTYAFYHGAKLSEGVRQVTWRGGPLPDEYFDEFVLSTYIARELDPGTRLVFPVTQTCERGELAWNELPAPGQDAHALKLPAPQLRLVAAEEDHAGHEGPMRAGGLSIEAPWTRATPAGAGAAAGYLTLTNEGASADVLLGATSDAAERVELHETTTTPEGVSSMRPLPDGVPIGPGETVTLKPLGRHLMLLGLKAPLQEGETLTMQLNFKHAGAVAVAFTVKPIGAKAPHQH
jgi:periplasmic copper chaperone A